MKKRTDTSKQLILEEIIDSQASSVLWLVDEHYQIDDFKLCSQRTTVKSLHILSNRFLNYTSTNNQHVFEFNDYKLNAKNYSAYDAVFLRVTKERKIYKHLLTLAFNALKNNGLLYLSGSKNEGINSAVNFATELFRNPAIKHKKVKPSQLYHFKKENADCSQTASEEYNTEHQLNLESITNIDNIKLITCKPGQFGWNKIDIASQLLASQYKTIFNAFKTPPNSFLDLGCGYGYLTLASKEFDIPKRIATDNNAAALASCEKNCLESNMTCEVIASDIAKGIHEKIDWIVCNPPFHRGFFNESALIISFLNETKRLLSKNGKACFVVNEFIPLKREAKGIFNSVTLVQHARGFKIFLLEKD